ncbi:MAG: pyruvate kinase [Hespellia sp.]|nr:pyruvate kinase [Hespellia sp.]
MKNSIRKTKVVCTLGPATDRADILKELVRSGMNVARLNFSHGTYEEHEKRITALRNISEKEQVPIAIMLDTKGPEIRIGHLKEKTVRLHRNGQLTLTGEDCLGDADRISISYPNLYKDVKEADTVLIDDGLIELTVEKIEYKEIICRIQNDGEISDCKGVNVPNVHIKLPYMSQKDQNDILFGIEKQVDFIAASFVRSADDVRELREFLHNHGGDLIHIVSKIENAEGVRNIDSIIAVSDAVMVARGDMGVELPSEQVPVIQKMIIEKVKNAGKQVVTATQMLDSMMHNPRPTRAETADVANAIYDGTSALMLSGETAAGKYPLEALQTMVKIAEYIERGISYREKFFASSRKENPNITDAISHASCTTAYDLNARAILTVTKSGYSARMISRYRPECMIVSGTTEERVWRQLNMSWGVIPVLLKEERDVFVLFDQVIQTAKERGLVAKEDTVVMTGGIPLGQSGTTNLINVQVVK